MAGEGGGREDITARGGTARSPCRRKLLLVSAAFLLASSAAIILGGQEFRGAGDQSRNENLLQSPENFFSSRDPPVTQSFKSAPSPSSLQSTHRSGASKIHVLSWLLVDRRHGQAHRGRSKAQKDPRLSHSLLSYILGVGHEAAPEKGTSSGDKIQSSHTEFKGGKKFSSLVEMGKSSRAIAEAKKSIEKLYQQLNSLDVRILQQEWSKLSRKQKLADAHNRSTRPPEVMQPYGQNIVHLLFEGGPWINETENQLQRARLMDIMKATSNMSSNSQSRLAIVNPETFSWLFGRPWRTEGATEAKHDNRNMMEIINQTISFNEHNTKSQAVMDAQHRVMNVFKEPSTGHKIRIVVRSQQSSSHSSSREDRSPRLILPARGSQLASRSRNLDKTRKSGLATSSFVPDLPGNAHGCKGDNCDLSDLHIFGQWLLVALAILLTVLACTVAGFICFGCLWAWREFRRQDRWDLLVDREIDKEKASEAKQTKVMQPSRSPPRQGKDTRQPGQSRAGDPTFTRRSDSIMAR